MVDIMIDLKLTAKEKEGLTEDEIELAMARKLEAMLLPHLRRDIAFFYAGGNLKGKSRAYNAEITKEEIEDLIQSDAKLPTVCKPLCEVVIEVLEDNGLNADTIACDTDIFKHTDVILTTKSGRKYIINYLEDMELVQTRMITPDFASRPYYERRYQKFEGSRTPDGKKVDNVAFLSKDRLSKIDSNIGYKRADVYMDEVIDQIKKEFDDFRNIMAKNEIVNTGRNMPQAEKERIISKYQNMSEDEIIEQKLDWIFSFFNQRENINGHTDFVMYYKTLLKRLFTDEEYDKMDRYDCFIRRDEVPSDSKLNSVLDLDSQEENSKCRFCIVRFGNVYYVFSTKPNVYVKLNEEEFKKVQEHASIIKSERPSDLVLDLCDRGNALPLVFNPIGFEMLNEREKLITETDPVLRRQAVRALAESIETQDMPITQMIVPYPDGTKKCIFIDRNNEIVIDDGKGMTIYHYDVETENFKTERR